MSPPERRPGGRPVVVIVGAGFGGLWAARALRGEAVEVLLLDRNNYHTFFPLLYQVAAAELGPTEIAYPVRSILRKAGNVRFRMAEVVGLDLEAREVVTGLERIPYDHLVLSPGSEPNFFGVEGAEEHAFPLRWVSQAIPLRHHLLTRLESAVYEKDEERRRALLTFAIVGGGPTGVEYAGALAELVYGPVLRDYPPLASSEIRVILLEMMDRLLLGMPEALGEYARKRLEELGVEVRLGAEVSRIGPQAVELAGEEAIATHTVVWTAGVKGDPRLEEWGLPVGKGGRVVVDEALRLEAHPEVWVVGDAAYVEGEDGRPLPQVAPVATQQGEHVARSILRTLRDEEVRPFEFRDPGMMAVIGRNAAVARIRGWTFRGFPAWIAWLVVHIAKLIGFRNRLLVLVNWAWNYLSYENAVRLILPFEEGEKPPKDVEGEVKPAREELEELEEA